MMDDAARAELRADYRAMFRRHRRGEKAERIGYVALCLLAEVAR